MKSKSSRSNGSTPTTNSIRAMLSSVRHPPHMPSLPSQLGDPSVPEFLPRSEPCSLEEAGWQQDVRIPSRQSTGQSRSTQIWAGLLPARSLLRASPFQLQAGNLRFTAGVIRHCGESPGKSSFCTHHPPRLFSAAADTHFSVVSSTGGCSEKCSQRITEQAPLRNPR